MEKEIVIDGNEKFDFIVQLLENNDIEDVEFRNCDFLNDELLKVIELKKYARIGFIDCTFEDESLIKKIKTDSLSLTNNRINNYEFIYEMINLKKITVVNGTIDAAKLNHLTTLEYLRLSNSYITNIENLFLKDLKFLFIDNTNIVNLYFIKNFPYLKLLSISEEQKINNINILKSISNHTKIILDSIIEMEVHLDE